MEIKKLEIFFSMSNFEKKKKLNNQNSLFFIGETLKLFLIFYGRTLENKVLVEVDAFWGANDILFIFEVPTLGRLIRIELATTMHFFP